MTAPIKLGMLAWNQYTDWQAMRGEAPRVLYFGGRFMAKVARRVGIAFGSFVIAWLAVSLVAGWLFGSGNILVWVFAAVVGAGVFLDLLRRDRRVG